MFVGVSTGELGNMPNRMLVGIKEHSRSQKAAFDVYCTIQVVILWATLLCWLYESAMHLNKYCMLGWANLLAISYAMQLLVCT